MSGAYALRELVRADLEVIWVYTVEQWGGQQAERYLQGLFDCFEELAANLYVGYSWLRINFKEQVGMAPATYHQHLRMEKAKDLLGNSALSIKQVSEALGFKTQNHFSALFKRCVGCSPSAWRSQHAL